MNEFTLIFLVLMEYFNHVVVSMPGFQPYARVLLSGFGLRIATGLNRGISVTDLGKACTTVQTAANP